ncbi:MAG: protein BatD [Deltaproteobacteria bacterium]|uniref:Protein BatD n=1 Tax=Candidatus Desulfacyla euxinica TaxID=2841693 RepID=A0A8J6T836_9DELT|nr:protein BatD [Candidatus Desulfacyla euxinica]
MKKSILLLGFFISILTPCQARAGVSVALSLDRQEATLSDSIRVAIKVSGTRSCDSSPVIKGLDSFQVSQGGSSSRVEIINGNFSSSVEYTYYIQPSKSGTFQLGPVEVKVDGKVFKSNISTLSVLKAASPGSPAKGPIFLETTLSSKKAYVEEQVLYILKLYLKTSVSDISLQLPELDHLAFKQLAKPREYQGVYHGSTYRIIEVPYGLLALKAGNYGITPSQMSMTAYDHRKSRRGFFDDPFFRSGRPVTISSQPLELKVIPLPEEGKPEGFSGLVGNFEIKATLVPSKINMGESATLTVSINGKGNVNRIPDLKMPGLEHIKVYADEPVFEARPDPKGLAGFKIMKWAIVPEQQGDYEIPPLSLSFFDPETHSYSIIQTPKQPLIVLPGKEKMIMVEAGPGRQNGVGRSSKQGVEEIGHDILPLHTSVRNLQARSAIMSGGLFVWLTLLLPFVLYVSIFLGLRLKKRSVRALPAQKARKAPKNLMRRCRQERDDVNGLTLCVRDYFNDRFGLALASLTPDDAADILISKGAGPGTAQKLRVIMIELENSIYTGQSRKAGRMNNEIPRLIKEIEREIR